jgi:CubicO group peptidase (beta-lactamase class C family)
MPGEQGQLAGAIGRNYTNVGFGLLGFLVGEVAGVPFASYCRERIFRPLGMTRTAWHLADIDQTSHAVPYSPVSDSSAARKEEQSKGLLGREPERADSAAPGYLPYCLYSFPNYPDGSLRTSVTELARFLGGYINRGTYGGARILAPATVATMLSQQVTSEPRQGLCWVASERNGMRYWGHDGGDPGVATVMAFRPSDGVGVIVFTTRASGAVREISTRLFEEAGSL